MHLQCNDATQAASTIWICYRAMLWMHGELQLMVDLLEANDLLDCLVCLIGLQTVWLPHQFMLFSTSVTIWWRTWDFRCPLSHLSDCSHKKKCRARFPQGLKWYVCVSAVHKYVSPSMPQTMTFGMICTTQLQSHTVQLLKIRYLCAVTSSTTSVNHAVHKYAGKRSTRRRTTVATLQSLSCPWCWNRAGCVTPSGNVSNSKRVCWAVPSATVLPEILTTRL